MKRINPRRAKLHRSYSVGELADVLGVHKHTVRAWLKEGLPPIDDVRPILILGSDFQEWWAKRTKAKKRPLKPGEFFCLKCRQARQPALAMVEYVPLTPRGGNLRALCDACSALMHRRVIAAAIVDVMPKIDVAITKASPSISGKTTPSLNTDEMAET